MSLSYMPRKDIPIELQTTAIPPTPDVYHICATNIVNFTKVGGKIISTEQVAALQTIFTQPQTLVCLVQRTDLKMSF
jgi:hypothetical protein